MWLDDEAEAIQLAQAAGFSVDPAARTFIASKVGLSSSSAAASSPRPQLQQSVSHTPGQSSHTGHSSPQFGCLSQLWSWHIVVHLPCSPAESATKKMQSTGSDAQCDKEWCSGSNDLVKQVGEPCHVTSCWRPPGSDHAQAAQVCLALQGFGQHLSSMDATDPVRLLLETPHRSKRLSARLLQPWSANTAQPPSTPGRQAQQHAPAVQAGFPSALPSVHASGTSAPGTFGLANQRVQFPSPGTPPRTSTVPSLAPSLAGTTPGASGMSSGSILGGPWPPSQQQGGHSQWSLPGIGPTAGSAAKVDAAAAFGSPNQTAAGGPREQASVGRSPGGKVKRGRSAEEDDAAGEMRRSFAEHQRQQQLLRCVLLQTRTLLCLGHVACPMFPGYIDLTSMLHAQKLC